MNYAQKEMVYDCIRERDVIVFDINTKLIPNMMYKRVKHEFPEIHKILMILALNDQLTPGDAIVLRARGYTFGVLVTQVELFGAGRDEQELTNQLTIEAIESLVKKLDTKVHYTSGILNRRFAKWERVAWHIGSKKLNWSIYTE